MWPKFETTFRHVSSITQKASKVNSILSLEEMKTLGNMRKWLVENMKRSSEGIHYEDNETLEDKAPSINIINNGEVLNLQLDVLKGKQDRMQTTKGYWIY